MNLKEYKIKVGTVLYDTDEGYKEYGVVIDERVEKDYGSIIYKVYWYGLRTREDYYKTVLESTIRMGRYEVIVV
jgi:hypothetical protein